MPDIVSPTPNEFLCELLLAHGYDAHIRGERILVEGHEAQWSAETFLRAPQYNGHLQLDVLVHLPDGRTLVESCSGIGKTPQEAQQEGFASFCRSSFHVLLNAFFGGELDVLSGGWDFPTSRFHAVIGDATFRGRLPVTGEEMLFGSSRLPNWFNERRSIPIKVTGFAFTMPITKV